MSEFFTCLGVQLSPQWDTDGGFSFFFLIVFFLYISNVNQFTDFPSITSLSHTHFHLLLWECFQSNHPLPTLTFPYTGGPALSWPRPPLPISAQWMHPLLHMPIEPCFYVHSFDSDLVPRGSDWLLLLFGCCKPFSLPSDISPAPPVLTPWFAGSICLCICHVLVDSLSKQLYQALVNMHFLASSMLSRLCSSTYNKDTCSSTFITSLFIIARSWREPRRPSKEE